MTTELFDKFWSIYPARNGKKLEKGNSLKAFNRIPQKWHELVVKCAINFAASKDVKAGFGIKDPKRFLANDYWREWVVGDNVIKPPANPTINAIPKCNNKPRKDPERMKKLFNLGRTLSSRGLSTAEKLRARAMLKEMEE